MFNKKISILHYIQFFFYSLVALTPVLMSSSTSEIFEFNKMMFIYLITLIVTFLYVANQIIHKQKIIISFLFVTLFLFLVSQILSTIYSIDRHTSIFGYYGRWNGGLLSIVCYISLVFIFIQTFTFETVHKLLRISLITSFIVVSWGLLAKIGYDFSCFIFTNSLNNVCWTSQFNPAERMFSTIGQPNWLGAYLAFHFFIGLYFLINEIQKYHPSIISQILVKWPAFIKQDWKSFVYVVYLILTFMAIIFTKSRSTLIAVMISLALGLLIVIGKKLHLKKRTEEIAILVFALGIFLTFFISWRSGFISNFFALPKETTTITDSFDIRKVVWKGAIDLGFKYPLFGSGVETFAYSYYFTRPMAHNLTSEWDFIYNKAHNEYLNYFATTGFVGISAYLLLIMSTFIVFIRYFQADKEKSNEVLVACLMLGYITILVTNFFGFSVSTNQIFFYLTPAFVIVLFQKNKDVSPFKLRSMSWAIKIALIPVTLLFLWGLSYVSNYYFADIEYAKGKSEMDSDNYQSALISLDNARRMKFEHVYEDKLSYTLANLAFLYSFEEKTDAAKYVMLSEIANSRTLKMAPQNMLYWRTRGKDYYLFYQVSHKQEDIDKGLLAFEEMVKLAPTDAQSRYTLALFYWIASGETEDKEKAASYLTRAKNEISNTIRMKPNYIEAQELQREINK